MAEKKQSFWDRIFSLTYRSDREELVLEYIIQRLNDGAPLEDILQEQYVRRHTSPDEVQDILDNPELVEAARKKWKKTSKSWAESLGRGEGTSDGDRRTATRALTR